MREQITQGTGREKRMMGKRAVLYARVSGDDRGKDGRNLASQLEMCREYALARGWQVVAELAEDDRGASGASFELPELGRVLQMAEARELDVLAVRELDRLSRNLAKQLVVEEELSRHDVQVEYVLEDYANTPEGRLNKHIRATIAEYEREKIAERMVRGRRNKVKAGNVTVSGRPPYGYIQGENNGKQTLVIHEPEARVVRMIFSWYAYGEGQSGPLGIRSIAHKLTNLKIPTYAQARGTYCQRDSAPWNESVISRMVRNPTYHGDWTLANFAKRSTSDCFRLKSSWDSVLAGAQIV
jgi:site-specific DNA recombinase